MISDSWNSFDESHALAVSFACMLCYCTKVDLSPAWPRWHQKTPVPAMLSRSLSTIILIYTECCNSNSCMISLWILISAFEELMETRDRSEWGWILIWETDIFLRTILWINQILEINRIWYLLRKSLYIIPSFFVYHGNSCVLSCPSLSPICPSKEPG